jgi:intracellular sulfur oxidation DsrE/DsrF family protein
MNRLSNEYLSAFVDGELSRQEVDDMFKAMGEDSDLAESACELRTLKLMVRHAYEDTLEKSSSPSPSWRGHLNKAIAAMLILALGSLTGWKLHESTSMTHWVTAAPHLHKNVQQVSLAITPRPDRVILHIDNDDPDQVQSALERASAILRNAQANHVDAHIEILANNRGLDMLRTDRSQVTVRIARLAKEYPNNLRFVACGQSIKRFEQEGQVVKLLPQVQIAPTAIGEIVTHLKEGWTYIKV